MTNSGITFRIAGEAEDGALRAVLRETAMPGPVSLAFTRDPSFFLAEKAGNNESQTLIAESQSDGKILGLATRSIRTLWVNQIPEDIGYLGTLRLVPEARGMTVLARGFRFLESNDASRRIPYYLASILSDNVYARKILESRRAGLPKFSVLGNFVTHLIPLSSRRGLSVSDKVERVQSETLKSAFQCLTDWNRRHLFAPVYDRSDLASGHGRLPNFSQGDMFVYQDGHSVGGTLGVWDQQSFKQIVVAGYSAGTKLLRPMYNACSWITGSPRLPQVGGRVRLIYGALLSAKSDEPEIFQGLLDQVRFSYAGKGYDYLAIGLEENHPLRPVAVQASVRTHMSTVYVVSEPAKEIGWPDSSRRFHLEVATL